MTTSASPRIRRDMAKTEGEKEYERRRREAREAIGRRLTTARAGRSIAALARAAGLPEPTLYRYEKGQMLPGADVLPLLAKAYGIELVWLITGEGEGPAEAA